jgi:hypothetical protein
MSVILFIDANQYLELYGLIAGKRLLDSLEEQKAHIFVSMQIVDEVLRRKLGCAQIFFSNKLKEVTAIEAPCPIIFSASARRRCVNSGPFFNKRRRREMHLLNT